MRGVFHVKQCRVQWSARGWGEERQSHCESWLRRTFALFVQIARTAALQVERAIGKEGWLRRTECFT